LLSFETPEPLTVKVAGLIKGEFLNKQQTEIRGSGYCVESLEAALWAFYSTESYEQAILAAVNLGDDADTTAAICGQLAGAYYGVDAIPTGWLEKLVMRNEMEELALQLYKCSMRKQ
jgi:ADP-ribosyl-[dinitrogen reductase] hydrolase